MMIRCRILAALALLLAVPALCHAGLYYSGEPMADLPSQWGGFLLDQQLLRQIGVKPRPGDPVHPVREQYLQHAAALEKTRKAQKLTADEAADLGAIYVRLGEPGKALDVLRQAAEAHPNHFPIAANLGTAWQMQGDLQQAAAALQQAVQLAPGKLLAAEQLHLKLVKLRVKEPKNSSGLDDLFGIAYVGDKDTFEPGKLAPAQKKKLPTKVAATLQQICLWLPEDGRLLWQLGEIANAYGDIKVAANMMDGCVTQFGMKNKLLRDHRDSLRDAVKQLAKDGGNEEHKKGLVAGIPALSKHPLLTKFNEATLPAVSATGINQLPWALLAGTHLDAKSRPTFPKYLKELDGKKVTLNGFMQPFKDEVEVATFMLVEYPIGCWYCEMPEITGIIQVDLPKDKTATYTRDLVHITGELILNHNDPEEFLYTIRNAHVGGVE